MKIKIPLTIFFALFLIIVANRIIFASDLNLPSVSVTPDKYLVYSIKRLVEKGVILTKLSKASKADYYKELVNLRLSELKYVVDNKLLSEVERSTQRLSYQIGTLSDFINQGLINKKKSTGDFLIKYKNLLENLRDQYPANSSYWMLVQHSINSLDAALEKLK